MDLLALAAAFAQPPDYLVAWQRAVGDDAEQLEATFGAELLGGKRQLRGVGQCRTGSRIARKRARRRLCPAQAGTKQTSANSWSVL